MSHDEWASLSPGSLLTSDRGKKGVYQNQDLRKPTRFWQKRLVLVESFFHTKRAVYFSNSATWLCRMCSFARRASWQQGHCKLAARAFPFLQESNWTLKRHFLCSRYSLIRAYASLIMQSILTSCALHLLQRQTKSLFAILQMALLAKHSSLQRALHQ